MSTPRFLKWLLEDWWLLLLAILAAILLWFFARLELEYTKQIKLPLDFSLLPKQYIIVEKETDSITVEVKAKGKDLLNIKSGEATVIMPVASIQEGEDRIRIGPENVNLPKNIKVLSLNPYQVEVSVQKRAYGKAQIIVPWEGFPAGEYTISEISPSQRNVDIYGTKEEVTSVYQLFTEPLDVENLKGIKDSAAVYNIPLAVQIPEGSRLVTEPSSVMVKVIIEPKVEKRLSNVPVTYQGQPPRGQVYPLDTIARLIILRGPKSVVEPLTADSIQVSISVASLDTGRHELPARFSLPPVVEVDSCNPKFFNLLIR